MDNSVEKEPITGFLSGTRQRFWEKREESKRRYYYMDFYRQLGFFEAMEELMHELSTEEKGTEIELSWSLVGYDPEEGNVAIHSACIELGKARSGELVPAKVGEDKFPFEEGRYPYLNLGLEWKRPNEPWAATYIHAIPGEDLVRITVLGDSNIASILVNAPSEPDDPEWRKFIESALREAVDVQRFSASLLESSFIEREDSFTKYYK